MGYLSKMSRIESTRELAVRVMQAYENVVAAFEAAYEKPIVV